MWLRHSLCNPIVSRPRVMQFPSLSQWKTCSASVFIFNNGTERRWMDVSKISSQVILWSTDIQYVFQPCIDLSWLFPFDEQPTLSPLICEGRGGEGKFKILAKGGEGKFKMLPRGGEGNFKMLQRGEEGKLEMVPRGGEGKLKMLRRWGEGKFKMLPRGCEGNFKDVTERKWRKV